MNFKIYKIILFIITLIKLSIKKFNCNEEQTPEPNLTEEPIKKEITSKALFQEEWAREMKEFEPDFVNMIPLDYKTYEVFYQNITTVPYNLKGALIIDEENEDSIDFRIESPTGQIVYSNSTGQCIFNIYIQESGVYKFYFDNRYQNNQMRVTFTLNSGSNNVVQKKDLDFSTQKTNSLNEFLDKLKLERKLKKYARQNRILSKYFII